ncbi:hypothetical protein ACTNEN_05380 [Oribacterium sp. HCP28S3_H8]|uniref:thioester domain-containing protein n=1 Tax=Oribacterium sp. HCP28S3_H8 TaxID=3438945 RepID=UPI003F8BFB3E
MHLSFKAGRFLPAVLSVALLLSTASAGVGYAEGSTATGEEVSRIIAGDLTDEYKLKITRGSEDYTIELYCMNNDLHWPDVNDKYKVGYLDFSKYPGLEDKLIKALYAGYPYNGMKLYSDATTPMDEETYNSFLAVPEAFKNDTDLYNILGDETYAYDDYKNNSDHMERLNKLNTEVFHLQFTGGTTSSKLSASDITSTAFYLAAFTMVNANDNGMDPVDYWNQVMLKGNDWKEVAHSATQNAIWMILQNAHVENNKKGIRYDKLAQDIYDAANSDKLKYLTVKPTRDDVTVAPEAQNMTYDEELGKWIAGPFRITENLTMYGGYTVESDKFTVIVKDASGNWENVPSIPVDQNFYLASEDEITSTVKVEFKKTVAWIEKNGLRQFTPERENSVAYQHMIGAIIHNTTINKSIKVKPAPDDPSTPSDIPSTPSNIPSTPSVIPSTPSDLPSTPSDIPSTPSDIPSTPSDIPSTPSDIPVTPETPNIPKETPDNSGDSENGSSGSSSGGSGSGSGGGSGSSGSTGIHSVFGDSRNTTTESKAGSTTESAAGTPPDDSNPAETIGGSVQGMNRNRPGQQGDVDGETAGASRSVQTGDHAHMILYLAVSLIALIGLLGWKRKADKQG